MNNESKYPRKVFLNVPGSGFHGMLFFVTGEAS